MSSVRRNRARLSAVLLEFPFAVTKRAHLKYNVIFPTVRVFREIGDKNWREISVAP